MIIYDNVTAVVETSGKHGQLVVGSLIRVGDVWRAIDVPQSVDDQRAGAVGGLFFPSRRPSARQPECAKCYRVEQKDATVDGGLRKG